MMLLLFLVPCVIAFVFGVLYFYLLNEYKFLLKAYDWLSDKFGKAINQRDKLEKDNKRYKARLEKWRKEVDNVHKRYAHLQQPSD